MKNLFNFVLGFTSTLSILTALKVDNLPPEIVDILKGLISAIGGLVSTLVVWFLNNLIKKRKETKEIDKLKAELLEYKKRLNEG
jgi:cell shape-determining protein MreC